MKQLDLDADKKMNEPVEEAPTNQAKADPRHTVDWNADAMSLSDPGPGCMICRQEKDLIPAVFYYGHTGSEYEYEALVRTTRTQSRVLGSKACQFCSGCLADLVTVKRKLRNKHVLKWLGGFLLWLVLFFAAALVEIPVLLGGVLVAGIVLAFRFVPRMMRNSLELAALLKKGGDVKYEDFLDKEAARLFLADESRGELGNYSIWTRSQYKILSG